MAQSRSTKPMLGRFLLIISFLLGLACLQMSFPATPAYADSPTITVGQWDPSYDCGGIYYRPGRVAWVYNGDFDLDSFTRDALPGEWIPSGPVHSLRSGATLIRADAYYFNQNPESNDPRICRASGTTQFDVRTSRIQGWYRGRNGWDDGLAPEGKGGLAGNIPSNRVTETGGEVLTQNGTHPYFEFNDCLAHYADKLASEYPYRTYPEILTNPTWGLYGSQRNPYSWCSNLPAPRSGLGIRTNPPGYAYGTNPRSMVNNTGPSTLGKGSKTSTVTPAGQTREGRYYWGLNNIEDIWDDFEFGEEGIFVKGWHEGDKAEYLMQFGGSYSRLQMRVISDRPPNVRVNVYVDGIYRGYKEWKNGDNDTHRKYLDITGVPFGTHAIALEYAKDHYEYPGDGDRNFYFLNMYAQIP